MKDTSVASRLYTAEASESKKRAKIEAKVPDPPDDEGRAAIEEGESALLLAGRDETTDGEGK